MKGVTTPCTGSHWSSQTGLSFSLFFFSPVIASNLNIVSVCSLVRDKGQYDSLSYRVKQARGFPQGCSAPTGFSVLLKTQQVFCLLKTPDNVLVALRNKNKSISGSSAFFPLCFFSPLLTPEST